MKCVQRLNGQSHATRLLPIFLEDFKRVLRRRLLAALSGRRAARQSRRLAPVLLSAHTPRQRRSRAAASAPRGWAARREQAVKRARAEAPHSQRCVPAQRLVCATADESPGPRSMRAADADAAL